MHNKLEQLLYERNQSLNFSQCGVGFNDVTLIPQYNPYIMSRTEVSISTTSESIAGLEIPIVSANMSCISEYKMCNFMNEYKGLGVLHRFFETRELMNQEYTKLDRKAYSVGVTDRLDLIPRESAEYIIIDIAHGHCKAVKDTIKGLRSNGFKGKIVAGNVATRFGAEDLLEWGADIVKIGISAGSHCRTRQVTGHGMPTLSSLIDIQKNRGYFGSQSGNALLPLWADGGIEKSGDIVKCLLFADAVMLGSLLSGTDEAANPDEYYGMSTRRAMADRGNVRHDIAEEGSHDYIQPKGSAKRILDELVLGVKSGLSYSGAQNIKEFREKAELAFC